MTGVFFSVALLKNPRSTPPTFPPPKKTLKKGVWVAPRWGSFRRIWPFLGTYFLLIFSLPDSWKWNMFFFGKGIPTIGGTSIFYFIIYGRKGSHPGLAPIFFTYNILRWSFSTQPMISCFRGRISGYLLLRHWSIRGECLGDFDKTRLRMVAFYSPPKTKIISAWNMMVGRCIVLLKWCLFPGRWYFFFGV